MKITCPECRKTLDVPERGVAGFPENRYVEDLLKMKKSHQCLKHFLPLHLFCDNEDCQVQICASCAAVKHSGHKLLDIEDKVVQLKGNMANTKDKAREISIALGAHLDELNKATEKVKRSTSENLDAVDSTIEELNRKIQELHEKVQAETEEQKMKLLQNQKNQLTQLDKAKEEVLCSKSLFDGLYMDVEKSMTLSDKEIIQINQTLENSFLLLKIKEILGKKYDAEVSIVHHDKPQSIKQLKSEDSGKLRIEPLAIKPPVKIKGLKDQLIKDMKEDFFIPEAKLLRKVDTEMERWVYTKMCVSKDGRMVLSGKVNDENWLRCFNANGDRLWQVKVGKADGQIRGLASSPDNEHFFATKGHNIDMRKLSDGQKIYEQNVGFDCIHIFCPSDNVLLVENRDSTPRKLVKFEVRCQPIASFEALDGIIETNLKSAFGCTMLNNKNKQLLIVTSWKENTIKAINYLTGITEWTLTGEYEGKKIEPHGVCCDEVGNLYVADGSNRRVLLVSSEGNVKQKLIDLPDTTYWIGFTETLQLIVHVHSDEEKIQVYQIDYKSP